MAGWAGQDYYFSRNESKNISVGAGFLVGWKLGGPVLGTMVAMWNQQGQMLSMTDSASI
jgi:hypothetical protein